MALQALFGFLATDRALRMAGVSRQGSGAETAGWVAVLLATVPFTFNRFQAHAALSSHWVLLLAVWVSLVSIGAVRRRWLALHVPLIFFLSGINPYLSVMGLLMSLILGLAALQFLDWKEFLLRSALLSAVWVGGSWIFGFLGAAGLQTGGYGVYSMNLLGPLDSNGLAFFLNFDVPDPTSGQAWEGFDYLGFGVILLIFSAGVASVRGWSSHRGGGSRYGAFPLANGLLVILVFLLLSLSNRVSLGSHVFEVPLPEFVLAVLGKFRASGRFFWVAGFMLVLICSVVLEKSLSSSKRKLVFAVFVVVQFLDIRPIALFVRESMQTAKRYPPLALGSGAISMIHVHPPWQCDPWKTPVGVRNFESIGYAAVLHQVPTNNFYAARNPTEQLAYHCNTDARLKVLDKAGVYVLNDDTYSPRKMHFEKYHWCQKEQLNMNSTRQQQLLSGTPVDQMFWICRPKMVSAGVAAIP
ncbi:hypothetical protein ACVC7V_16730 [Hydrogenophaga sp. A37]|uniref:hypothetical protein n=1 Tax=Hydrogenophaga sp. A37 TaxID=1945864 RepID=UPI00117A3993|nr:hypothetical protein [Hydrogenophaga sp. A37]